MTLFPRAPRVLLQFDDIVVSRPSATADADGNTNKATPVFTGKGTVSIANQRDFQWAGQRGTVVDKVLSVALGTDVQAGDFVLHKGTTYEVMLVDDRRLYRRAVMSTTA